MDFNMKLFNDTAHFSSDPFHNTIDQVSNKMKKAEQSRRDFSSCHNVTREKRISYLFLKLHFYAHV